LSSQHLLEWPKDSPSQPPGATNIVADPGLGIAGPKKSVDASLPLLDIQGIHLDAHDLSGTTRDV